MTTEIVPFDFNGHMVRVVKRDGKEEWIAKDVCEALGISNTSDAIKSLDPDEKSKFTELVADIDDTESGAIPRTYTTVTEPGLYRLIFKSTKPQAKEFMRWATHEVLPKIRRTGFYVQDGYEERVRNVLDRILRHKAANWELMWKEELPKALAPVYGLHIESRQFPVWMVNLRTSFGD